MKNPFKPVPSVEPSESPRDNVVILYDRDDQTAFYAMNEHIQLLRLRFPWAKFSPYTFGAPGEEGSATFIPNMRTCCIFIPFVSSQCLIRLFAQIQEKAELQEIFQERVFQMLPVLARPTAIGEMRPVNARPLMSLKGNPVLLEAECAQVAEAIATSLSKVDRVKGPSPVALLLGTPR